MKGCLGEIVEVMIDNDGRYSVGILELPPLEYTHYIHSVTDIFLIIWCIYNVWYELKVISIFLNQNNLLRSIYVCFFYIIFHFKRILIGFNFVLWARRLEIHQIIERLSNLVCQATWLNIRGANSIQRLWVGTAYTDINFKMYLGITNIKNVPIRYIYPPSHTPCHIPHSYPPPIPASFIDAPARSGGVWMECIAWNACDLISGPDNHLSTI